MWANVDKTKALYVDRKGKYQWNFCELKVFWQKMLPFTGAKYPSKLIRWLVKEQKHLSDIILSLLREEYFQVLLPILCTLICPLFFFFWWKKKSALFRKAATWEDGRLATPKPSPNMPYILELVFHKGVFKNRHFKLFFQGHYTLNMLSLCSYL